jgi:hypothetical protein
VQGIRCPGIQLIAQFSQSLGSLKKGAGHKERQVFRSSKMSPFISTFIVSPHVYEHTAFLDDFFGRSFPYTQAEATPLWRTCGESSPKKLPKEVKI